MSSSFSFTWEWNALQIIYDLQCVFYGEMKVTNSNYSLGWGKKRITRQTFLTTVLLSFPSVFNYTLLYPLTLYLIS